MHKYTAFHYNIFMKKKYTYLSFLLYAMLMMLGQCVWASHNLAGQITCKYLGNNKYEILLTTYTDPAPAQVDRCAANFEIWNASGVKITTLNNVPRENGPLDPNQSNCSVNNAHLGEVVYQTVKENIYRTTYTFPGPGKYLIRYFDPTRRADIVNMQSPGEVNFYVETEIFHTNPLAGANSTPVLLNRPLDEACIGKLWTHNPGGYDPDGDSLVYSLVPSQQYDPTTGTFTPINATGYLFPDNAQFGFSSLDINPKTGLVTWQTPQQVGVYNVAYKVVEYRNGVSLGHVVRDMVIIVKSCPNDPPVIETITDTCVRAGDTLRFAFQAYDKNVIDSVYLALNNANAGNNGPFAVANPATIQLLNPFGGNQLPVGLLSDTIKGNIQWITLCDNVRKVAYQVDFYAHDNFSYIGKPGTAMLTAHKAVAINVIPPSMTTLTATKGNGAIQLDWEKAACTNAVGYNVYRKLNNAPFVQDTVCCDFPPQMAGFTKVAYIKGWGNHTFADSLKGITNVFSKDICYVITAMYGDEFNPNLESCASEQVCVSLKADTLYLTDASVLNTDFSTGSIFVGWAKPDSIDAFFAPPFSYRLYRGNNNQFPAFLLATQSLNDTTFTDVTLDTKNRGYNYRVEIVDAQNKVVPTVGNKSESSSIFLSTLTDNGQITLNWKVYAAWNNQQFHIYRSLNNGTFTLLATIQSNGGTQYSFIDANLNTEVRYCYYIESVGTHAKSGIKDPLVNRSNESCGYPRNDTPPCTPAINTSGNCIDLKHTVTISKSAENCDDLTAYVTLHYATTYVGPYSPVAIIPYSFAGNDTTITLDFVNNPTYFAGCYTTSATNVYGFTSALSTPVCVDYCPIFDIPNVFTPNGDGIHDDFTPIIARSIVLTEIQIFDRWGTRVHFNKGDISTLWNGKIDQNAKEAAAGVYYYYIKYEEQKLAGNELKEAKGWVLLMR